MGNEARPQGSSFSPRSLIADLGILPSLLIPIVSVAAVVGVFLQIEKGSVSSLYISLLIIGFLIIQSLMILGLQRSRVKYKRARKDLKRSRHELELRVIERTNKLRSMNGQLYKEIAKHETTEELLRETQDYLNSIINSMPSILIGITREGTVTHWNTATASFTGIDAEHALGRSLSCVYPEIPIPPNIIADVIDKGAPHVLENHQSGSGPNTHYSDVTVYPLLSAEISGAVIRIDDVSMRVRIENMMIQNEKMMSLGELAAGTAHEINNPLGAILHGLQNIHRRTSIDLPRNHEVANALGISVDQVREYLSVREVFKFIDSIREAGERAARIVTNMLEFSRSNSRRHSEINIANLLQHSLELAANSFELKTLDGIKPVIIHKELSDNLPLLVCSASEIQQVILNLLRNACQAFGDTANGDTTPTITLRAYSLNDNVCIEVEDNGSGMPESVRRHIFEPFFTTKDVGKGTGLGLSVSYFIVTEHHSGNIEAHSELGRGTCFIITLPMHQSTDVQPMG